MSHERRLRIVAAFLIVWICAIAVETVSAALLGHEIWSSSNHIFSKFVFVVGLSWQLVFQGPSRVEIMQRVRRRYGADACRLDRVYMFFNIDRTIRVIIVIAFLSILGALMSLAAHLEAWPLVCTAVLVALIAASRIVIVYARVAAGQFGTTQYEARELLTFLSKMHESSRARFDPPGRLQRLVEVAEPVSAPHNARVAL